MDYIKRLEASKIGIFENLEIEFSNKTNIVIGGNSSGKTTILKLITYSFSNSYLNNTRLRKDSKYHIDLEINKSLFRVGLEKIVAEDQDYRQFKASGWVLPKVENTSITPLLPYNPIAHNLFAIGASRYFDYKEIKGMQREKKGQDRIDYYKNTNSQFLEKPMLPDIKQWMINRYFVIEKEWAKVEKKNWEFLVNNINNITPSDMDFRFSKIERDLEPMFIINGTECYLEELSSGIKSILSILFSVIDWIEGVNEGDNALISKAKGTLLIDEIDAHLHPNWQTTIVESLRFFFPKLQFIFTTHSPHIVSSAKPNEIIKIPKHNGTVKLQPSNKSYKSWELENILNDLMDIDIKNSPELDYIIDLLDESYQEGELSKYNSSLKKLKKLIHPSDTLIQVYEMKRSRLILKND